MRLEMTGDKGIYRRKLNTNVTLEILKINYVGIVNRISYMVLCFCWVTIHSSSYLYPYILDTRFQIFVV